MNSLAPIRNYHRGEKMSDYPKGPNVWALLTIYFLNGFESVWYKTSLPNTPA